MLKFTTESGAHYEYDETRPAMRRVGDYSSGISPELPDETWHEMELQYPLRVGSPARFFNERFTRITTEVKEIHYED